METKDSNPKNNLEIKTEEKEEGIGFFSKIINFIQQPFKGKEPKDETKIKNVRGGNIKCSCPKTKSKNYCDNIYEIISMGRNDKIDSKINLELYLSLLKIHDNKLDTNGENITQIKKDLHRTFPSSLILKEERMQGKLKNVLRAFSNFEPSLKYFQGMNFIVGFFLLHCEEYIAFWLFVSLLEDYDYRKIFMNDFAGMIYHVNKVKFLLSKYNNNCYKELEECKINYQVFMMEWLYSLFSSLIPLDLQMSFYKGFFCEGWKFFYKMCLSIITSAKGTFGLPEEIYIVFKQGTLNEKVTEEFSQKYWKKIIQEAYKINIDKLI